MLFYSKIVFGSGNIHHLAFVDCTVMLAVMSLQIQMPTAPHPVYLPLSLPATVISLMTGPTLRPSRGVQTHQGSPFSTCPTGRGIAFLSTNAC